MSKRADQLARDHTEQAIATLAAIMNNTLSEDKDRLKAADSLLDRGHGKPLAALIQLPPSKLQLQLLAAAEDDELLTIMRATPLPRLAGPETIEAQFTQSEPVAPPITPPITRPVVLLSQWVSGPIEALDDIMPAEALDFQNVATARDPLLE